MLGQAGKFFVYSFENGKIKLVDVRKNPYETTLQHLKTLDVYNELSDCKVIVSSRIGKKGIDRLMQRSVSLLFREGEISEVLSEMVGGKMFELKNQFVFAPVKLGYSADGKVNQRHLSFYKPRSIHVAAVIPEPLYIHKGLREIPTQLGIDHEDKIQGLQELTGLIHSQGSKVIAHLNHPGRMANPKIPGNFFESATDKPCENGGATPDKLDKEGTVRVKQMLVDASVRAEKAGFDAIELQFGHGYLMAQFISPSVNDRTDEYGGSFQHRVRFPMEVLQAVQESVGLPVVARISGDEMTSDGIKLPDMLMFAKLLEENGIAAIHVSAGSLCSTPPWYFQHMFVPKGKTWEFSSKIKSNVSVPVMTVGQVNELKDIDTINNGEMADYIAVGRALVADPDFVGKCLGEVTGSIVPCLACAEGCLGGVKAGRGLQCLVNPRVGRDGEATPLPEAHKTVAVVGGGLAGMEAAVTIAKQGHKVTLYEKNELGGQFVYAPLTPHKRSLKKLLSYYEAELRFAGVLVVKKEIRSMKEIEGNNAVVLATGAIPVVPNIEGLNHFFWAEVLLQENLPENKNVLIIGGGLIGVDVATALIPGNNTVTIVKRTTDFGEDMEMISKKLSLAIMKKNNTVFSDHTNISKVDGKTVYAVREGQEIQFNDIDLVVVSTGMKSYNPIQKHEHSSVPIFVAGDAGRVADAEAAIKSGYDTAMKILKQ